MQPQNPREYIPICNREIETIFSKMTVITLLTMAVGILFYGEKFNFWTNPISDLGVTVTAHGHSNLASLAIFAIGMLSSGILMLKIAIIFKENIYLQYHKFKYYISIMTAFGFFIITYPHNINNNIHSIGGALLFGGLWGLTLLFLIEAHSIKKTSHLILYHLILHSTVLTYAFNFVIKSRIEQITQKIAILSLMIILKLSTSFHKDYILPTVPETSTEDTTNNATLQCPEDCKNYN